MDSKAGPETKLTNEVLRLLKVNDELHIEVGRLRDRVLELRTALENCGEHHSMCGAPMFDEPKQEDGCTCGLTAIIGKANAT